VIIHKFIVQHPKYIQPVLKNLQSVEIFFQMWGLFTFIWRFRGKIASV
jgi:hypothetical protein